MYYDPTDPGVSSLVEFAQRNDDEAGPIPALALGIVGILAYIFWRRYRVRRAASRS